MIVKQRDLTLKIDDHNVFAIQQTPWPQYNKHHGLSTTNTMASVQQTPWPHYNKHHGPSTTNTMTSVQQTP